MPPNGSLQTQTIVTKRPVVTVCVNGQPYEVDPSKVSINTSLNTFLRSHAQLTGTKFMCLEGGCGICIVTATGKHPVTKEYRSWAINSCLTPIYACSGLEITTIEGIGNQKDGYHPAQQRLAQFHGTQCGFCSPGMVMNMYSLLEAAGGKITQLEVENSFGGNICRCTGYRPILDAFKSLAVDADPKYKEVCGDIEDLPINKICPKTGDVCAGKCGGTLSELKIVFEDGKEWYKVGCLEELLTVLSGVGSRPYMLVAGNTAHGVYRRNDDLEVFIDINDVPELHRHQITEDSIVLGGNVSLTDTMSILQEASKGKGFEYLEHIVQHIDLVANVPVRSAGTLAGNFSIKHQQIEFPSDLFITFVAAGAKIRIVGHDGKKTTLTLEKYLKFDMSRKLILEIILPSRDPNRFLYRSYKIMPRAQNAHAYVNAAFLFEMESSDVNTRVISSAKICFGGIEPNFIHAINTERYLVGKKLHDNAVIQNTIKLLQTEIHAIESPPDASPEYRNKLAISLFYKFLLSTCPEEKLNNSLKSGGEILRRPVSTGLQDFDTNEARYPMTQPIQKLEGQAQCSGEAKYVNDIPYQPGELWAAFVHSTRATAKIVSIDASEALKIPGIRHVFTAKDIPGMNNFSPLNAMLIFAPEEILCSETLSFYGQPIALVLADTFELANKAEKYVKVEYEDIGQPVISSLKQAYGLKATDRLFDAPFKHVATREPVNIKTTLSGHFEMGTQYHYTMETQCTLVIPIEDGLDVFSATQHMDTTQIVIAKCLNIPESSINMQVRRLGGAYGAKITRSCQIACAAALGAKLTNRPVRFVMSLESNMTVVGKRNALISDYEANVDEKGVIQSLNNQIFHDYGCSINELGLWAVWHMGTGCYDKSPYTMNAQHAITNSPSNTWCRAPGTTEAIANYESIIEHIAFETGIDPIDVRLNNIPVDSELQKTIPEFLESIDFRNRRKEINQFNSANRWTKKGIAFVPMQYPQLAMGPFSAIVSIYHTDGTVNIMHGGIEMGQGINTKVAQVAAHVLGIPIEYIRVKPALNYVTPNAMVTGGSMASDAVSLATFRACEELVARMADVRAEMKDAEWTKITEACYAKQIELAASYYFKGPEIPEYSIWGVSSAEIEIDLLTGSFLIRRVDILEDTGESLSPWIDVGQVEGAFIMGLGYWLNESIVYDQTTGELLTNRTWTYKPPGAKDIPIDFRVKFFRNSPNPVNVLSSKATGEPALCMAVVALFALRYALEAAREDAGLPREWIPLEAPTTVEKIFLNAGINPVQFIL